MQHKKSYRNQSLLEIFLISVILISLNFLGSSFFKRFDLTEDKRFTISDATKQMLKNLEHEVTIKIYLDGDLPPGFIRLKNSAKELLDEYQVYAKNNLTYEFVDELSGKTSEEKDAIINELDAKRIKAVFLTVKSKESVEQQIIVPGALVTYMGREIPVQLLEDRPGLDDKAALNLSESMLEYNFSSAIRNSLKEYNPNIAFIGGHGESPYPYVSDLVDALLEHSNDYLYLDITNKLLYSISDKPHFDQKQKADGTTEPTRINFDVAIISKPMLEFSEDDKFKIDQFIMHGGKVIWLIDRTTADMDSFNTQEVFVAMDRQLNLDDLLFTYGVRLNTDLITDYYCNPIQLKVGEANGQPQFDLFPWYYFPVLRIDNDHPIVAGLDPVASKFAGTIDTVRTRGIKKTVLLHSSANSEAQLTPVNVHFGMVQDHPGPDAFQQQNLPVAVLLEGEFSSVFNDRVPQEFLKQLDSLAGFEFIEKSAPNKMIVISDGDIIESQLTSSGAFPLGWYRDTETYFSNKQFLLNSIEYLVDGGDLLPTQNKIVKMRLLDPTLVDAQKTKWQIINTVVPIAVVLLFGLIFNFLRRRKFAR